MSLDKEIARERAEIARLEALAAAGNPIAEMALKRIRRLQTDMVAEFKRRLFREA